MQSTLGLAIAVWLAATTACAAQTVALRMTPPLADLKEAENLSGAACVAGPRATCILIGDEKLYARTFTLVGDEVRPGATTIDLLPAGSDESDAEGIAAWDGAYYLVGSHGLSKKEKLQASRFYVWRVAANRTTGAPDGAITTSTRLRALLAKQEPFNAWAEKPLRTADGPNATSHGVNIEGIAVNADGMFLAFRGPVLAGKGYVLKVKTDEVFTAAGDLKPTVFPVDLDANTGLRDIVALKRGFLLLTGPEADADGPASILFWNGSDPKPQSLASVGNGAGVKPESLTLLSESADAVEVLVLSDGVAGGAPLRMRLKR